jgi:hypothetical protein
VIVFAKLRQFDAKLQAQWQRLNIIGSFAITTS